MGWRGGAMGKLHSDAGCSASDLTPCQGTWEGEQASLSAWALPHLET